MEPDYKNTISHIDIDRSLNAVEYFSFNGMDDPAILEFNEDVEGHNDSIELHLIKSKSYKEGLILRLKKSNGTGAETWREFLKEEQKTFGGSKIFYMNNDCSKLLVLSIANEMTSKINMMVTRLNKINERITRINAKIKKENLDLYESRAKGKQLGSKTKDEIVNFINQNLRV